MSNIILFLILTISTLFVLGQNPSANVFCSGPRQPTKLGNNYWCSATDNSVFYQCTTKKNAGPTSCPAGTSCQCDVANACPSDFGSPCRTIVAPTPPTLAPTVAPTRPTLAPTVAVTPAPETPPPS
eukprot:TRINITY_DN246_c0_g1_i7.p1 TRINITY_DN246_c0_g1~~TRINITY_DN246_c0_g1_i7.p1  ORF type:complete len:126 (-),score=17.63 TRINITY_DN246_c0_g1_i7:62-439(-)